MLMTKQGLAANGRSLWQNDQPHDVDSSALVALQWRSAIAYSFAKKHASSANRALLRSASSFSEDRY